MRNPAPRQPLPAMKAAALLVVACASSAASGLPGSNGGSACPDTHTIDSICDGARRSSAGNCLNCLAQKFSSSCTDRQRDAYCAATEPGGAAPTSLDLDALQAALPAGGGSIYINSSVSPVLLSKSFVITKPIRLHGDGVGSILQEAPGAALTALIEVQAPGVVIEDLQLVGMKSGVGGVIHRGVLVRGTGTVRGVRRQVKDVSIRRVLFTGPSNGTGFNFGVDAVAAHGLRIEECRFERGVSSDNNGAAILLEGSQSCTLLRNKIDATEFVAADGIPSAAIMLSAFAGGIGSSDNTIEENTILNHPQVCIAQQSTTYAQFRGALGECARNRYIPPTCTVLVPLGCTYMT